MPRAVSRPAIFFLLASAVILTGCSKTTAAGFKNGVVAARYPGSLAG